MNVRDEDHAKVEQEHVEEHKDSGVVQQLASNSCHDDGQDYERNSVKAPEASEEKPVEQASPLKQAVKTESLIPGLKLEALSDSDDMDGQENESSPVVPLAVRL